MTLLDLAERVRRFDGVAAFGEAALLALAAGDEPTLDIRLTTDDHELVAAAVAFGDAPVEFAVDPRFRRAGLGSRLLAAARAEGTMSFWAHGDLAPARSLAARAGLSAGRTLLLLRRSSPQSAGPHPAGSAAVRPLSEADVEAILAINARAFAGHPDQGLMDRAAFDRRRSAAWFDPSGLLVTERAGKVIGFHWTKIEGGAGEVYVLAVDPDHAGTGVGRTLLDAGLAHLATQGVTDVELYVEADNTAALALYVSAGFSKHRRDVVYR